MSACETGACNQDMSCRHHSVTSLHHGYRHHSALSARPPLCVSVVCVHVCVYNRNSFAVISLLIAAFPPVSKIISYWRKKKQRHSPNYKVFSVSPKSSSKVRSPYLSNAKQHIEPDKTTIYACTAPKHKSYIADIIL